MLSRVARLNLDRLAMHICGVVVGLRLATVRLRELLGDRRSSLAFRLALVCERSSLPFAGALLARPSFAHQVLIVHTCSVPKRSQTNLSLLRSEVDD